MKTMKVEGQKENFKPVVVVLETQEEINAIYAVYNTPWLCKSLNINSTDRFMLWDFITGNARTLNVKNNE